MPAIAVQQGHLITILIPQHRASIVSQVATRWNAQLAACRATWALQTWTEILAHPATFVLRVCTALTEGIAILVKLGSTITTATLLRLVELVQLVLTRVPANSLALNASLGHTMQTRIPRLPVWRAH